MPDPATAQLLLKAGRTQWSSAASCWARG